MKGFGTITAPGATYALSMGEDDKVVHMTKTWNAPWALRELGWAD